MRWKTYIISIYNMIATRTTTSGITKITDTVASDTSTYDSDFSGTATYTTNYIPRWEYIEQLRKEIEILLEKEKPKEGWKIPPPKKPRTLKSKLQPLQLMPFKSVIRTRWFPRKNVNKNTTHET